jgi:tRNA modification GTPase
MTTIFAPITSSFKAGVVIVRISGPKVLESLRAIGFNKNPEHQKSYYHKIFNPETQELIDETLISFFKGPHSLTGEDVAEIGFHASPFILKKVFAILSQIEDVRFAEAGEFLKTAFLNGKIDLVQAEAVPDLISAETEAQHRQATRQLQGELGNVYNNWRQKLIEILAQIEAFIDFPEDDLPQNLIDKITTQANGLSNEIAAHLNDDKIGQKIKDGFSLVIIGPPNAGKSSLINFLAKSEVAIVSEVAGTTRDVIEIHLSIAGFPVKIADTAGLRESEDKIEKEGIKRALKKAENADLKILVLDALNPLIPDGLDLNDTIILLNKIDLNNAAAQDFTQTVPVSLKEKINLDIFIKKLEEKILEIAPINDSPLITQERYRIALNACLVHLAHFSLDKNIELAAEDLRLAAFEIGKIVGKIDIENILDEIFSRFCIGK